MRIIVEYKDTEYKSQLVRVVSANYVGDYTIHITFSDGFQRIVDFKPFLSKSIHPSIKKYNDEIFFSKFSIADGNLNWNDYDLIFPIADLYNGEIIRAK